MALVDEGDEVLGKIVYEAERPLSGAPPVEVPGIILNAGAISEFLDHLHVVFDPLLETVGLVLLPYGTEILALLHHVVLDHAYGVGGALLGGDEDVSGIDRYLVEALEAHAADRVDNLYLLYRVSEKYDAAAAVHVGQVDVYRIALYPEGTALEIGVAAVVESIDEAVQELVAADTLPGLQRDGVVVEVLRVADAVEAGDRGDHYHVAAAREQGGGGGQAQLLYLVVDAQVLLDVGVGHGQVGLGLVVVVVGYEILYGVVREKGLELPVELCCQGLVVAEYQGRPLQPLDHVGHRESLARACDSEQGHGIRTGIHRLADFLDGLRLVARRPV